MTPLPTVDDATDHDPTSGPDPVDIAIGAAIRRRRREARISQEGLAARINVSFQQVQKYERGANRVPFSRLVKIARALGCSVRTLIGSVDAHEHDEPVEVVGARLMGLPDAAEVLTLFEELRPAARRALLTLLRERRPAQG